MKEPNPMNAETISLANIPQSVIKEKTPKNPAAVTTMAAMSAQSGLRPSQQLWITPPLQ